MTSLDGGGGGSTSFGSLQGSANARRVMSYLMHRATFFYLRYYARKSNYRNAL
jgi:hypothetical protein